MRNLGGNIVYVRVKHYHCIHKETEQGIKFYFPFRKIELFNI